MKNKLHLILIAGCFAASASASELSIAMADHQKFTLGFDNSYYQLPSNTYNVTMIQAGMHHVRMTSDVSSVYGAYAMPQLLFDGWVNIPDNVRMTGFVNNMHQLVIQSSAPMISVYDPYNQYGNGGYYGNNGYYDPNVIYGPQGNYGGGCGNGNPYGYPQPVLGMPAADFQNLKASISAKSFESSKLTVAEQAAAMNNLSAQQVLEIVQLFSFESTKLEFAKYAYGRTADKNNYYLVNNGFDFESSITELSEYINTWHS